MILDLINIKILTIQRCIQKVQIDTNFYIKIVFEYVWPTSNSEYVIFHVKVNVCSFLTPSIHMCMQSQCCVRTLVSMSSVHTA